MYRSLLLLLTATAAAAQTPARPPLLPDEYETALARTAAPASLSDSADLYVLRRGGFERVRRGSNGAACLVGRDHPESLYPICYDPEAARTILPRALEAQRLRELGLPEDSVEVRIARAYAEGGLRPPARTAIAYMMSRHQVIYTGASGRRVGEWYPHLMIYMPGLTRGALAMPGLPSGDLTLDREGAPDTHFVVMTRDWAAAPPLPPLRGSVSAQPGWLCPGDSFRITHAGLSAAPAVVERTDSQGRQTSPYAPEARYVARGRTVISSPGVPGTDTTSIHPDRMEHNFVRERASCAGRLSLASMAVPPAGASDRIRPRSVTNRGADPITVTHRGVTVRLAPGETTHAFDGLPFSGDWGVVVDTGAYNPFCPVPTDGRPATAPRVDVLIVTACP
ncbi:MAG TPA: hypothetical protein VHG28_22275 [Longimicrobiaceae bacterium]|nr:hypothetical protein [Longimicrobiaceae bacterium]